VKGGVEHLRQDIFLLHLLEVKLRVAVQPVSYLDDVEELEGEDHAVVRVAYPQRRQVQQKMLSEIQQLDHLKNKHFYYEGHSFIFILLISLKCKQPEQTHNSYDAFSDIHNILFKYSFDLY